MSGILNIIAASSSAISFTPSVATSGSGTLTSPTGSVVGVIQLWGVGGGGSKDSAAGVGTGGGSGAYITQTVPCTAGTVFTYTFGTVGLGRTSTDGNGTAGTASTLTATVTSGTVNLTANGGKGGQVTGASPTAATASSSGTATPTAAATSGNVPALNLQDGAGAPNGGGSSSGAGAVGTSPGGGGAGNQTLSGNGGNGALGRIQINWS